MTLLANAQAGASATKREVCVRQCVGSANQATSRTRFMEMAIRTCWSCVFGEAVVARLSEAEDARPLRQGALDAGAEGVARLEVRRLLPATGRE
jgi:hypothetical protein